MSKILDHLMDILPLDMSRGCLKMLLSKAKIECHIFVCMRYRMSGFWGAAIQITKLHSLTTSPDYRCNSL